MLNILHMHAHSQCTLNVLHIHSMYCIFTHTHTHAMADAGSPCMNGAVRLVGGNSRSGRLELCLGGVWGSVCKSRYGRWDVAAQVICRQLGYNTSGITEYVYRV